MNKLILCREILMAMEFLNIPSERYGDLKKQCGGVKELHEYLSKLF